MEMTTVPNSESYIEAETVSEDSEISSLSNRTDGTLEVRSFLERIQKVKDLIQELEESFRECNNNSNNLILRCVLLRAENQNLIFKVDQRKCVKPKPCQKKHRDVCSVLCACKNNLLNKYPSVDEAKHLSRVNSSESILRNSFPHDSSEEIDILYKTIDDLQKKLREKNVKLEELCQKYSSLKTNKIEMETDLRSQIIRLEEQLNVTNDTLAEFRDETEADIEETLSSAVDTNEALFLQERLRCSKLMYEKVRLHHEIQRLQDVIRRQTASPREKEPKRSRPIRSAVDKASSEPLMRRF